MRQLIPAHGDCMGMDICSDEKKERERILSSILLQNLPNDFVRELMIPNKP